MAAWIASNWLEQDRSWSFDLTAHCPLRLSTMNWLSATLVEPAEQPDQQDDWDRNPDQPEQKTFTHCVLLFRLAHINVRWELRFHGMTQAESGQKQGLCEQRRARERPGPSRSGIYPRRPISLFNYRMRIERERRSRNVRSYPADARSQDGRGPRGAPCDRQPMLGTPLHHTRHRIFCAARPASFAAAYVIGIPTDDLFDCRVPNGSRAGVGHPSIISPRLFLMRVACHG